MAKYAHRDEARLQVDAEALEDGRTVRFIIEVCAPGAIKWKPLREVEAVVTGGRAKATAILEHPDDRRHHAELRFRAEIVPP